MTMLGQNSFKKAIEEAEKLSESLKLRLEALLVLDCTRLINASAARYNIGIFLFNLANLSF